jgi:hypothetical protein
MAVRQECHRLAVDQGRRRLVRTNAAVLADRLASRGGGFPYARRGLRSSCRRSCCSGSVGPISGTVRVLGASVVREA